jgi:hypothetical protein
MSAKLPNAIRRRWKTICRYHQKEKLQEPPWLTVLRQTRLAAEASLNLF